LDWVITLVRVKAKSVVQVQWGVYGEVLRAFLFLPFISPFPFLFNSKVIPFRVIKFRVKNDNTLLQKYLSGINAYFFSEIDTVCRSIYIS